jgi:hypothetical protein
MKTELTVELNCPRCNFTKIVKIDLDDDGVYSIPNKFCPNDMHVLSREVLADIPVPPVKNEPKQDTTTTKDPVPKPTRPVDRSKDGSGDPKKTG